jgi:serine transporter
MAYFAHLALSRFVLSAGRLDDDSTDVVEQRFGFGLGVIFTILYFIETCITLLVYAISLTDTVESFISNQLHWVPPSRWLLSLILITVLVAIASFGIDVITKVVSVLVYPVIAVLVLFSLYLIPKWNLSMITSYPQTAGGQLDFGVLLQTLWLLIPVMISTFDHSAIVSFFSETERKEYGDEEVDFEIRQILRWGELLMVGVVMFFVIS